MKTGVKRALTRDLFENRAARVATAIAPMILMPRAAGYIPPNTATLEHLITNRRRGWTRLANMAAACRECKDLRGSAMDSLTFKTYRRGEFWKFIAYGAAIRMSLTLILAAHIAGCKFQVGRALADSGDCVTPHRRDSRSSNTRPTRSPTAPPPAARAGSQNFCGQTSSAAFAMREPKAEGMPPRPWRAKHAMDTVRQLIGYGVKKQVLPSSMISSSIRQSLRRLSLAIEKRIGR
ncbi:hypothetical protein [Rhizobium leguminosarum]|uniref:hypothetical protein n=1 Tax=Rhizobium leguminosarum TaxID=384 RepID=UPI001C94FACC|nr:hypothetical protein [Rhizobium leguminosarum]MBY5827893.1 hypothetical protein [Rhizobium leguminosarum]